MNEARDQKWDILRKTIYKISDQLDPDRIGTGGIAELRRLAFTSQSSTFWHVYFTLVPEELRTQNQRTSNRLDEGWKTIIQAMAELAPRPHNSEMKLGQALVASEYSEHRFIRFVRSEGNELRREVRIAAHWIASNGKKADCIEVARLILVDAGMRGIGTRDWIVNDLARKYFGQTTTH